MRKVFLLVLLLSFGPLFFLGCIDDCSDYGPCPEVELPYFSVQGIRAENIFLFNKDDYSNYRLNVLLDVEYHAMQNNSVLNNGVLMACERSPCPMNGYKGSQVGLDTILVIAKNDYDFYLSAGDTINRICRVGYRPLWQYIQEDDTAITEGLSIKLATRPMYNPQAFKVIYTLDDGRSFEAETEEVYLWP